MRSLARCLRLIALIVCGITLQSAHADLMTQAAVDSSFLFGFPGCSDFGANFASAACSGPGFEANAWARAGYGTMQIFTEATQSLRGLDLPGFGAASFAEARDFFTVLNADPGQIFRMEFTVDGEILQPVSGDCPGTAACESDAYLHINSGFSSEGTGCLSFLRNGQPSSDPYECVMETVLTGASFFSDIQMLSVVELRWITTGRVDFASSLNVTRVVVLLPNGQVDPDAIILSESGFNYPDGSGSMVVPEPATVLTTLAGMAMLIAVRVSRRQQRQPVPKSSRAPAFPISGIGDSLQAHELCQPTERR